MTGEGSLSLAAADKIAPVIRWPVECPGTWYSTSAGSEDNSVN